MLYVSNIRFFLYLHIFLTLHKKVKRSKATPAFNRLNPINYSKFRLYYSLRKAFTGLAKAARTLCKLTVTTAISTATTAATTNAHQGILVR